MKNLPVKKEKQVTKYNPATAKVAKDNLLKHVDSYPKELTEQNIKAFVLEGNEHLKVYQAEWKPIANINKSRLEVESKLKTKLKEAKEEFKKIAQLKQNAKNQISFYAQNVEVGKELEKWNEYFAKFGKYSTYSFSEFEALCNQFQLQKQKEKEFEKLSKFEQMLNEPTKVQSVEIKDVDAPAYKTTLIVDFDKLDCRKAIQILVDAGKSEHITDMLRIALKSSKEEIQGITYVDEINPRITRN